MQMSLSLIGIIRKLPTSLSIQTNLMLWLNNTGRGFYVSLGFTASDELRQTSIYGARLWNGKRGQGRG